MEDAEKKIGVGQNYCKRNDCPFQTCELYEALSGKEILAH